MGDPCSGFAATMARMDAPHRADNQPKNQPTAGLLGDGSEEPQDCLLSLAHRFPVLCDEAQFYATKPSPSRTASLSVPSSGEQSPLQGRTWTWSGVHPSHLQQGSTDSTDSTPWVWDDQGRSAWPGNGRRVASVPGKIGPP